jgi:hypothetical protein
MNWCSRDEVLAHLDEFKREAYGKSGSGSI